MQRVDAVRHRAVECVGVLGDVVRLHALRGAYEEEVACVGRTEAACGQGRGLWREGRPLRLRTAALVASADGCVPAARACTVPRMRRNVAASGSVSMACGLWSSTLPPVVAAARLRPVLPKRP